MKTNYLFLLVLLSVVSSLYGTNNSAEKTYTICVKYVNLNTAEIAWNRTDGTSENTGWYHCEYGIKGFKRGEGILDDCYFNINCFRDLKPDTEYSLFIRKETDEENAPVWFEEYNFKTLACNAEILGIFNREIHRYGRLVDIEVSFDDTAESYELEYGEKGFQHGEGSIITSILGDGQKRVYVNIGNENLQSNTEYDYYVRGKCGETYGEWSEKRTFVTTDMLHYAGDETFEVFFEDITHESVTVRWKRIDSDSYSAGYRIEYGIKGFERGKGENAWLRRGNVHLISGLLSGTEYSFFIRSEDKSTESPVWSVEHTFKTLPCNTEISNIETYQLIPTGNARNGVLTWIFRWNGSADSYELEYGEQGFDIGTGERMYTEESEVAFSTGGLKPYTDYEYHVRGECGGEYGEWSDANYFYSGDVPGDDVGLRDNQVSCLKVYPNPTDGMVYIDFGSQYDLIDVNVTVYSVEGLIVSKFKYQPEYDMSFLQTGIYLLSISDGNFSETLILQKM